MQRVASQELAISEAELEERLQAVCNLLPDLADRLFMAPPKRIAALASNTRVIAARLLRLREIFPKVCVARAGVSSAERDTHLGAGWTARLQCCRPPHVHTTTSDRPHTTTMHRPMRARS